MDRKYVRKQLKTLKRMCPTKDSGFTSITITHNAGDGEKEIAVLTPETRKKIDEILKRLADRV